MKPTDISELRVFLFSLYHLKTPLPDEIQQQIDQINIPADVPRLYDIAMSYPPLASIYNQIQEFSDNIAEIRSKGVDCVPQPQPEPQNTEIENISAEIVPDLAKFEQQVDRNKLIEVAKRILTKATDSVAAAKDILRDILL